MRLTPIPESDFASSKSSPAEKALQEAPRGERRGVAPPSFDRDAALGAAMRVFWERGYEAASIFDLVSAMGVSPPRLYRAFHAKAPAIVVATHEARFPGRSHRPAQDCLPLNVHSLVASSALDSVQCSARHDWRDTRIDPESALAIAPWCVITSFSHQQELL